MNIERELGLEGQKYLCHSNRKQIVLLSWLAMDFL